MEILIQEALITPGNERGRTGKVLQPQGIVIHYVGNPGSSAMANRNYFENGSGGNKVSAHYIVGLEGEIIRCIPENERAAHAGKSYGDKWKDVSPSNNGKYLGIETCHPASDGKFSKNTYKSLVKLTADICCRYEFDAFLHLHRHYDVSGKNCPLYFVTHKKEWNKFRNAVFSGILVQRCKQLGCSFDAPYWERVLCGEITPEYEYLVMLEERITSANQNLI